MAQNGKGDVMKNGSKLAMGVVICMFALFMIVVVVSAGSTKAEAVALALRLGPWLLAALCGGVAGWGLTRKS